MFKIKKKEPNFFNKAIKKAKTNQWDDKVISNIRAELREYILKNEQNYLCAYCEKIISSNQKQSNIDHFKKKESQFFPKNIFNYDNLVVSCNTNDRCSSYKDNKKNGLIKSDYINIINPIVENPNDYFYYLPTGELLLKDKTNIKSSFTRDIFNLQQFSLEKSRAKLTPVILQLKDDGFSLKEIEICLYEYKSFVQYIYENF
jgi:uncharacterized protein (TIGR02646 family)